MLGLLLKPHLQNPYSPGLLSFELFMQLLSLKDVGAPCFSAPPKEVVGLRVGHNVSEEVQVRKQTYQEKLVVSFFLGLLISTVLVFIGTMSQLCM